jgi:hypothetical protein
MGEWSDEFAKMKEIIVGYDKNLCQKVDRTQLFSIEKVQVEQ